MITITNVLFLCAAGFLSAFVDSIAGGGGLISVPAYFLVGLPPHFTLGTNKFSSTCGSFTSSFNFARSGKVDYKLLKFLVPCTFIGAAIGVNTVLSIDTNILKPIVLSMLLIVGVYSLFSKSVGMEDKFKGLTNKSIILGCLLAVAMGFYDGFFGPGTGSFLIFGLIKIFGFDFVRAGGNSKVLNFTSNIVALALFAFNGKIKFLLGLPMAFFMILGARCGSKLALKNGAKLMKPIFVTMSLAVAAKMLWEVMA